MLLDSFFPLLFCVTSKFDTDVNDCLKLIKLPNSIHMYTYYTKLPSNICTVCLGSSDPT